MKKLYLYTISIRGFYLGSWIDVIAESKQHAIELGKIAMEEEQDKRNAFDTSKEWKTINFSFDGIDRREIEPGVVNLITGDY